MVASSRANGTFLSPSLSVSVFLYQSLLPQCLLAMPVETPSGLHTALGVQQEDAIHTGHSTLIQMRLPIVLFRFSFSQWRRRRCPPYKPSLQLSLSPVQRPSCCSCCSWCSHQGRRLSAPSVPLSRPTVVCAAVSLPRIQ